MSTTILVEVRITTTEKDVYHFPAMLRKEALAIADARPNLSSSSTLVLTNTSGACLTVPIRIIDTIHVEGEELWKKMFSNA